MCEMCERNSAILDLSGVVAGVVARLYVGITRRATIPKQIATERPADRRPKSRLIPRWVIEVLSSEPRPIYETRENLRVGSYEFAPGRACWAGKGAAGNARNSGASVCFPRSPGVSEGGENFGSPYGGGGKSRSYRWSTVS